MIRLPPRSTRTDTLFPYTTLFRSFARRAIGRADDVGHRLVHVGVGQDDAVILRAAHRLDALAVLGAAGLDVIGDVGRSDEADRLDGRRSEERRVGKECVSTCRYRLSPYP